ncbi:Intermediate cleaving peptidase 55 [Venturia inaequalis]|nr:Intermediate cleaving peptidase 55 [Venturia inaequalis]
MGIVRTFAIAILAVSVITFVAFFGRLPVFRNTPIGFLHRVVWIHVPRICGSLDSYLTGGRLSRTGTYLLYEKHYVVTFFFLGLLTGSVALFLPPTWPFISIFQKCLVFLLVPLPYIFTYLCQISGPNSPHIITAKTNHSHLLHYPFDHVLYHPDNLCRTCAIPKPARSKHCSICKACVARSDHHCVWVNNCVGRGNYKYFLGLLFFTSLLLFYGSYLAVSTLRPQVRDHFERYPWWHSSEYESHGTLTNRFMAIWEYWIDILGTAFMVGGISRGGVGMLSTLTAPLPLGLLVYHIYLIWAGMTTNETSKWSDVREDMNDGEVFIADLKHSSIDSASASISSMDVVDDYRSEASFESEWPQRSRQFLIRTHDGQPPKNVRPQIADLVVQDSWRRTWHLGDVENIYDLGFWGNVMEALVN